LFFSLENVPGVKNPSFLYAVLTSEGIFLKKGIGNSQMQKAFFLGIGFSWKAAFSGYLFDALFWSVPSDLKSARNSQYFDTHAGIDLFWDSKKKILLLEGTFEFSQTK
jgi:hypothetical protein